MSEYAVVDLEMCRVPKERRSSDYHWSEETIQIGAVLLDEALEIKEGFCTYVAPKYGVVDPFIRNLTGIREKDIAGSPDMAQALQRFLSWPPTFRLMNMFTTDWLTLRILRFFLQR